MVRTRRQLGKLEQQVLQLVLDTPDCSAERVRMALRRPLRESTVRTVLTRLEQKGLLAHKVEQRTYLYRASQSRGQMAAKAVQRIADWLCSGSVDDVLLGMVEAKTLDRQVLQRLLARIDERKKEKDS
ncbi:MAG TPA: BlaI/MecI/CopY family transcriptional regulator [Steroidobacteraceae bacterium]|jgi:predicted transcriptional regulator|nr:BlaI/MecI/CopY family transcriptional regulator [Steroidobacteraceae bacterium]